MAGDNISLALAMGSAFVGAMTGCCCAGFWLASKFNNVYRRLDEHEKTDIQRFADLKALIGDRMMQAQITEGWVRRQPN